MQTKSSDSAFWQHHVEKRTASGFTQAAYCRQQGLVLSQFGYWHRKLSVEQAGKWLPVEVRQELTSSTMELVLAGDRCLRIPTGFDPSLLKQIIQAVESAS